MEQSREPPRVPDDWAAVESLEDPLIDIPAEQALIGIALADAAKATEATSQIRSDEFSEPLHQRIWKAIGIIVMNGAPLIVPAVAQHLIDDLALPEVGGAAYLIELAENAFQTHDLNDAITAIRMWARRREIRSRLYEVEDRLSDPQTNDADALLLLGEALRPKERKERPSDGTNPSPEVFPRFIDFEAWNGRAIPEVEWTVLNMIPHRNVTLLSGEGAVGKSTLVCQLGVATVLGKEWLGVVPRQGPTLLICCEDDERELVRRFSQIAAHYGVSLGALNKDLHVVSFAGQDAVIAAPSRDGGIEPTARYDQLMYAATGLHPSLIILDNSADIFGGSEIDRTQVRQFIGLLRRLSMEANSGVVLTSHPSLTGISSGTGISGSTAWHASVRARLYMHTPKPESDDEADPNERVLDVMKSNYGPAVDTISLRWENGLFLPKGGGSRPHWLDRKAAQKNAEEVFLRLLKRFGAQGRHASHQPTSHYYAPSLFCTDPVVSTLGFKKQDMVAAMNRLFAAGHIKAESYGRPSRPSSKIVEVSP